MSIASAGPITLGLAFFVIYTSPLFMTGILSPVIVNEGSAANLMSRYGGEGSVLVSFFKHPSIAGKVFALCTAIITFFWLYRRRGSLISELFFVIAILLGFYCTYLTFVRTAWFMLIIILSIGAFSSVREFGLRHWVSLGLFLMIVTFLIISEPAFVNRILGQKLGATQELDAVAYSSGRLLIWLNIYDAMKASGLGGWIFGLGAAGYFDAVGNFYAHNMFVQIFAFSGIVGTLIVTAFFIALIRYVFKTKADSRYKRFVLSVIFAYVFAALVSHGLEFWGAVLLAGLLVELQHQHQRFLKKEQVH
ncbi:O-antigen ligase family protein [Pseudomonadales bacterium]|nr:O-antigen ligase family protein [Pseudomonadales bacterium]